MEPVWITACFALGFFTAIGAAIIWVNPFFEDQPATVPSWVYALASWGTWRPRYFERPPRPHDADELSLEVRNATYMPQGDAVATIEIPRHPWPVPVEADEWGDPDGAWVDQLHEDEYVPRHAMNVE